MRRRIAVISIWVVTLAVLMCLGSLIYTKLWPHRVERSIEIDAPASQVWDVLTDTAAYPEWNPFLISSTGEIRAGATLRNTLRNHGSEMTFTPEVLTVDPERELRWIGRFGMPGVVDGEHYFRIEQTGPHRVRFTQGEEFSGLLVPVAGSALDVGDAFDAMNQALKRRVE
ncbi:MAG: SRPBCC domain-containing protein [Nakamurella sp.]